MGKQVSVGSIVAVVVVLLGVLGAYAIGATQGPAAAASATPTSAVDQRTLVTNGVGEVTGIPDQLSFDLAVTRTESDVSTALANADRTMRDALNKLAKQGVVRRDIQTTGLSVDPQYRYYNNGDSTITGYSVTENATVLLRDLKTAGKVISSTVATGGNAIRLSDVQLKVGDTDALMAKARAAAVKSAKAKGSEYAAAAGQSLGKLVSLKEVSAAAPQPVPFYAEDAGIAGLKAQTAVPIRAGTQDLKVTVQVVWQVN
ncbi:MAG: hypothetical protein JWR35_161 [Marmoricola sp.]|nr:hypothetical protein [Marmoricola sp.]